MKVLLVQPNTRTIRGTLCPPFGIMYVGEVARNAGHQVKILDRNVDYFSLTKMRRFRPDIVGISTMTGPMLLDAIYFSKKVKKVLGSHTPVVWGGVHASTLPEDTLRNDYIDYVVVGEGEYTFFELLSTLESQARNLSDIKGLAFKEGRKIIINDPRTVQQDLDSLPYLPWDMINSSRYFDIEVVLVTSRGCPFSCSFCLSGRKGKQFAYRCMTPQRVLAEIHRIEKLTANRSLKFHDDFFTANLKYCSEIFKGLSSDYSLLLYTRVDFINEQLLDLLSKFRKAWLSFGVESGSERMLRKYRKVITVGQIRSAFQLCKTQENIRTKASVILGGPTETHEEMTMTLNLMKEINPTRHTYCAYTPYPGTALYEEAVSSGFFKPPKSLEGWAEVTMHSVDISRNLAISDAFLRNVDKKGFLINLQNFVREAEWNKLLQRIRDYHPFLTGLINRIEGSIIG